VGESGLAAEAGDEAGHADGHVLAGAHLVVEGAAGITLEIEQVPNLNLFAKHIENLNLPSSALFE